MHDFETQTGETFEASVIDDAQQFTLHQFDIGLLELRAGPRFTFSRRPQPPWLPTNTGESDALQILIQSTQRGNMPTPPPPPPEIYSRARGQTYPEGGQPPRGS